MRTYLRIYAVYAFYGTVLALLLAPVTRAIFWGTSYAIDISECFVVNFLFVVMGFFPLAGSLIAFHCISDVLGEMFMSTFSSSEKKSAEKQPERPKLGACVLIERDGKVLGVARKRDHNDWGLPGGKVDENETFAQAAVRELFEETGIRISESDLDRASAFCALDRNAYVVVTYRAVTDAEPSQQPDEAPVAWVSWDDLKRGSMKQYNTELEAYVNAQKRSA